MTQPAQHRGRGSKTSSRATRIALTLAVMLLQVIVISQLAHAQFNVLYSFTGGADGGQPYAPVITGTDGNLYGTTNAGGNFSCSVSGCGVVYKLTKSGNETVLHSFTGGTDGVNPLTALTMDEHGNFYGTTLGGGIASGCLGYSCGTVFKISPHGSETVLHRFTGGADGGFPTSGLVMDKAGDLYGTTGAGGDLACSVGFAGCGVVYKLTRAGKETVLYSFTGGTDGADPSLERLSVDTEGNLYGTTYEGGDLSCNNGNGCGTVFKLNQGGGMTVLHRFTGGADGSFPYGVTADMKGNLYGAASSGGAFSNGVVFKISGIGGTRPLGTFSVLYSFDSYYALDPRSVTVCRDGNVYGVSQGGGATGWGMLWKVDPTGTETVVHSFDFVPGGGEPTSSPHWSQGTDGAVFYGTTVQGGSSSNSRGVVYSVDVDSEQQNCVP